LESQSGGPPLIRAACSGCAYRTQFTPQEDIMAKDQKPAEELSAIAEQTKEQALAATDTYFNFLKKTISSYPSGGTQFGDNLKTYAEKNIAAVHDFVHKLSQAKDFQDVFRLQTEFMQSQFSAFTEQTKNLGETYTKSAAEVLSKPLKMP
jgi:phasin family protein